MSAAVSMLSRDVLARQRTKVNKHASHQHLNPCYDNFFLKTLSSNRTIGPAWSI